MAGIWWYRYSAEIFGFTDYQDKNSYLDMLDKMPFRTRAKGKSHGLTDALNILVDSTLSVHPPREAKR